MCGLLGILHVYNTGVLHVWQIHTIHMVYTCNMCVGYTTVLHMYFYICNKGEGYIPVLHVW